MKLVIPTPKETGLFLTKEPDNTIKDISDFFERYFENLPEQGKILRPLIKIWLKMDLKEIIKSEAFLRMPIHLQEKMLHFITIDYRYIGDKSNYNEVLELLKIAEEENNKIRIYFEVNQRVLNSKSDGLSYLENCISDTKDSIIQSGLFPTSETEKKLINDRLEYLKALKEWVETYPLFKEPQNELNNQQDINDPNKYIKTPKRGDISFKLNLLHQFGIIQYLNKVWALNNLKGKREKLVAELVGSSNEGTIQPLLSSKDDERLRTKAMNEKIEDFLNDFGLDIDNIKIP